MSPTNPRPSIDEKIAGGDESYDLEAQTRSYEGLNSTSAIDTSSRSFLDRLEGSPVIQKLLSYPAPGSLELKSTSWLDGVRGVAALGVYIFHAMGLWASLVPAWHADTHQNNIFQLPLIRTIFVSGGAAVAVFFAVSGYVLTYKTLKWMRTGKKDKIYPAVASSMFRRGFRLYLPPVVLTFCEMIATRFGFTPPLNFSFVAEPTLLAQFVDWLKDMHGFINPLYTFQKAMQGIIVHPKYDAVLWTIPIEFWGSFVLYTLLLLLARIPSNRLRMLSVAIYAIFSMQMGSWNIFCFSSGMLIADFNLGQEESNTVPSLDRPSRFRLIWTIIFAVSFYAAGFPTLVYDEAKQNPMPGFEVLRAIIPMNLAMEDHSRFIWSLSGVALLASISQLPIKGMFETNFCQYLGKISFSLYLVHEFCLILFGLRFSELLMAVTGVAPKSGTLLYWIVCAVWFWTFTATVWALAAQVEKRVDAPSVRFARVLERRCLKVYKSLW
jgi:peptidoglycan/LPS O-acetylase OafA/YrhL